LVETITLASIAEFAYGGISAGVVTISKAGAVIGYIVYTVSSGNYTRYLYLGSTADGL
jgi:hypothetical protein